MNKSFLSLLIASFALFACNSDGDLFSPEPLAPEIEKPTSVHFSSGEELENEELSADAKEKISEEIKEEEIKEIQEEGQEEGRCYDEGNLVENGSFECNDVNDRSWGVFANIPGWSADLKKADAPIEVQCGDIGGLAGSESPCHIELDSHAKDGFSENDAVVVQNINTVEGACYDVSFDYSPRTKNNIESNLVYFYWDNQGIEKLYNEEIGWKSYKYLLKASSDQTRIEFSAYEDKDSSGGYLDNVRVEESVCEGVKDEEEIDKEDEGESVDNEEIADSGKEICLETQLLIAWGDLPGNTKETNRFGDSYVRILNEKSKLYSPDLIKFEKNDAFYGYSEDNKQVNFYTLFNVHYDGLTIRSKMCHDENKKEYPEFEIKFGDKYKKRFKVKKEHFANYSNFKGEDIVDGHGLLILGVKADAEEVHFLSGNWRPKTFKQGKNFQFNGTFGGDIDSDAKGFDGRLNGKYGYNLKNKKQIFLGKLKFEGSDEKLKIRGRYLDYKDKKGFGNFRGSVIAKDKSKYGKIYGKYFSQNGDKHGAFFGYVLKNNAEDPKK